jgi:hypothetical protein
VSPILGIWASQNYPRVVPDNGAMFPLGMVSVGSAGSATISFTSIPSTYKHLQIRCIGASNRTGFYVNNWTMTFNSDTASNYFSHYLQGGYSTTPAATAGSSGPESYVYLTGGSTGAASNIFTAAVIDILDYASTSKFKTVRTLMGYDVNGTGGTSSYGGAITLNSGLWRSTSAVSSLTIGPESFNWIGNSSFALYGIK